MSVSGEKLGFFCFHLLSNLAWNSSLSRVFASLFLLLSSKFCFGFVTVPHISSTCLGEKGSEILFLLICLQGMMEEMFHILVHIISHLDTWYQSEQAVKCLGFTSLLACPVWNAHIYLCKTQKGKTVTCSKRGFWGEWLLKSSAFKKKKIMLERGLALQNIFDYNCF